MKPTKYEYLWIVQGYYPGTGWEDLCASETHRPAFDDLKAYRLNAPETSYRIIQRRELREPATT